MIVYLGCCTDEAHPNGLKILELDENSGAKGGAAALGHVHSRLRLGLFNVGLSSEFYSRDYVHSGELGKQIIGRVALGYFVKSAGNP